MTEPTIKDLLDELARATFGAAPSDIPGTCINCRESFSDKNCHTEAGWKESKISGLCENCFDTIVGSALRRSQIPKEVSDD